MKIIVLDKNLVQQTIISSWIGATFNQRINSQGSFEIRINANSKQAGQIELGQIVYLESHICGYINRIEYVSEKDKASEVMTISGIDLKDTMRSRITYPPNGEAAYSYTETKADVIAVDLLNKLLINPVDTRKKVSLFKLGGTTGVSTEIDFSTRLKPLDKQIYELLSMDKIGLKCSVDLDDALALPFGALAGGQAGVVLDIGDGLKPSFDADDCEVFISSGFAFCGLIPGWWYHSTDIVQVDHDSVLAGMKRIDLVVLRMDRDTEKRKVSIEIIKGDDALEPSAKTLEKNETAYELGLAEVHLEDVAGTSKIISIKDIRCIANYSGSFIEKRDIPEGNCAIKGTDGIWVTAFDGYAISTGQQLVLSGAICVLPNLELEASSASDGK